MKVLSRVLSLTCLLDLHSLSAQQRTSPLVIDMHVHAPLVEDAMRAMGDRLEAMDRLNVQKAVLIGNPDYLAAWVREAPDRFIPSLLFPCEDGRAPFGDGRCFPDRADFPDLEWLREEIQAGRVRMLGEVISQLFGIFPGDSVLQPYFALAAELDIPVALHMGFGPPWTVSDSPVYVDLPKFRAAAGNPLELEEVLARHENLRLFVMHAGWPMLDEMLAILYHHPNVYVELGYLQSAISREEYYFYLKRLVDAGYGDRIMFGSDGGVALMEEGIRAVLDAPFLTDRQKRDILYNNAAGFLRLPGHQGR